MNDVPRVITKETLGEVPVPLRDWLFDLVRAEQEIRIEWEAHDYVRISLLWGLFRYESGERRVFTIKGKPGYCEAVVKELQKNGSIVRHD